MKIAFVAPGAIDIPPKGWGALETVIWNQYINIISAGHEAKIINTNDTNECYKQVLQYNPDILHLHYGQHYEILPHIHCRKIVTNHDGSFLQSKSFHEQIIRSFMYDCEFFILTTWERDFLKQIGLPNRYIKILPNGVDCKKFNISRTPKQQNKSICLGKIDSRKQQASLQKLDANIVFVGQNHDKEFNSLDPNYIGSWSRDEVFTNLTDYSNLVLLSQSELQPLVCLEALSAGLGLVISEVCSQNLDISLPFISVIPQEQISNKQLVKETILVNRQICNQINRSTITNYASHFDWSKIVSQYIQHIESVL